MAEIPATPTLTDVIVDRASRAPHSVLLRRREAASQLADVNPQHFRAQVRALASALDTADYPLARSGRPKGWDGAHRSRWPGRSRPVQGALHQLVDVAVSSTVVSLPLAHVFARIIQVPCLEGGAVLEHLEDSSTLAH